jgi:hypothetical protein
MTVMKESSHQHRSRPASPRLRQAMGAAWAPALTDIALVHDTWSPVQPMIHTGFLWTLQHRVRR